MKVETIPHIVRQGEFIERIAFEKSLIGETIWHHARNRELAERREDLDLLCPGDVVHVPVAAKKLAKVQLQRQNTFSAIVPTMLMRVRLCNDDGKPITDEPFELEGASRAQNTRTTAEGIAEFNAPINALEAVILLPRIRLRVTLRIGTLDPMAERSGIRQRLANVGYGAHTFGSLDVDTDLRAALRAFQKDQGLSETGEPDEPTTAALTRFHSR